MEPSPWGYETSSLFKIPLEIRLMVYRYLLCQRDIIQDRRDVLYPAILRTCRQVLSEASPVLYGENTWRVKIFAEPADNTRLLPLDPFGDGLGYSIRRRTLDLRRLDITVEVRDRHDLRSLKPVVRRLCETLVKIPCLECLHLRLDGVGGIDASPFYIKLKYFGSLRHVGKVKFTGVPPIHAEYLERKVTDQPEDDLQLMYEALEGCVTCHDTCDELLREARSAVEAEDMQRFKDLRRQIVRYVKQTIAESTLKLFDYEQRSPRDEQAIWGVGGDAGR